MPILGAPTVSVTVGFDRRALRLARVRVQPRRHIHGQHGQARRIDALDQADPLRAERPVQADAEQAVNHQRGPHASSASSRARSVGGLRHFQHLDPAVGQVFPGAAGVLPVVALAGEDQDQIARLASTGERGGRRIVRRGE